MRRSICGRWPSRAGNSGSAVKRPEIAHPACRAFVMWLSPCHILANNCQFLSPAHCHTNCGGFNNFTLCPARVESDYCYDFAVHSVTEIPSDGLVVSDANSSTNTCVASRERRRRRERFAAFAIHAVADALAASARESAGRMPVAGCGALGGAAPEWRAHVRSGAVAQTVLAEGVPGVGAVDASLPSGCDSGVGPHGASDIDAAARALRMEAAPGVERVGHRAARQERRASSIDRSSSTPRSFPRVPIASCTRPSLALLNIAAPASPMAVMKRFRRVWMPRASSRTSLPDASCVRS